MAGSHSPYHVNIIVVECGDRISRSVLAQELFFQRCRKYGIQVWAADSEKELVNATGDPVATFHRQIVAVMAEWDRAKLVNRLLSGKRRKRAETGQPCGGPRKYHDQAVIADIVRYRFEEGRSFGEIAALLNDRGIPTRFNRGKGRWNRCSVFWIYRDNAPEGPPVWGRQLRQALNQE